MQLKQRFVITGGPSSGKTSILENINSNKIICFEEVGRKIISKYLKKNNLNPFLNSPIALSNEIFELRFKDFKKNSKKNIHFYDRGIHDVVAYLKLYHISVPNKIEKTCKNNLYDKIFLLPPWKKIYVNDNERLESFETSIEIYSKIKKVYKSFGMDTVDVPIGSIKQRINFIYNMIELL